MTTPYGQQPGPYGQQPASQWPGPSWAPPPAASPSQPPGAPGGPQPFPGPPFGGALPPPPPGPPKRRTGLIIAACAGTGVLLIGIAVLVVVLISLSSKNGPGSTPVKAAGTASGAAGQNSPAGSGTHTLTIPQSAGGYTRFTGNVAKRLVAAMRQQAELGAGTVSKTWAKAYSTAKISLYTHHGTGRLVFIGFSTADTPLLSSVLNTESPSAGLDSFFLGAGVSSTRDFPPGPLGGALRCGISTKSATPVVMCAWADSSVLAIVVEAGTSDSRLAGTALAFRNAAEH